VVKDRTDQQLFQRKTRDQSLALVLIGAVLLMPPVVSVCLIDGRLFGIPAPLVYMFTVWSLLVVGAALLSRSLLRVENTQSSVPGDRSD